MALRNSHVSAKRDVSEERLGAVPDRLNSWKEIARYLEREVRTVQLWEKFEGLPVHRHFHSRQGSVFAFRSEIECWRRTRTSDRQSYGSGCSNPRIKIMAIGSALPDCHLFGLISDTVDMLSLAEFEIVNHLENPNCDYVLRLRTDLESSRIAVDVISTETQKVVWSRSLNGETSPSALARSIALLSRVTSVESIWNTKWLPDVPLAPDFIAQSKPALTPDECAYNVQACGTSEQPETRTWPCLSRGAACGFCRCSFW